MLLADSRRRRSPPPSSRPNRMTRKLLSRFYRALNASSLQLKVSECKSHFRCEYGFLRILSTQLKEATIQGLSMKAQDSFL